MTHTLSNEYVWHDLTEDFYDLPKDSLDVYVVTVNSFTGEVGYFHYSDDYVARYDSKDRIWRGIQDLGDYGWNTVGYGSHGIDPITDPVELCDEFSTYEVVAWAEIPEDNVYIPEMFQKENAK